MFSFALDAVVPSNSYQLHNATMPLHSVTHSLCWTPQGRGCSHLHKSFGPWSTLVCWSQYPQLAHWAIAHTDCNSPTIWAYSRRYHWTSHLGIGRSYLVRGGLMGGDTGTTRLCWPLGHTIMAKKPMARMPTTWHPDLYQSSRSQTKTETGYWTGQIFLTTWILHRRLADIEPLPNVSPCYLALGHLYGKWIRNWPICLDRRGSMLVRSPVSQDVKTKHWEVETMTAGFV